MELIVEHLEGGLGLIATLVKILLEALGILTILIGLILNGRQAMTLLRQANTRNYIRVRTRFARSLALALEFQLGADILATAVDPNYQTLGKLAAIAVIRTFLNYFLAREIKELEEEDEKPHS